MKTKTSTVKKTSSFIIMTMIVSLSLFGKVYSQNDTLKYVFNERAKENQTIEMFRSAMESFLQEKYGHEVKADPSLAKSCIKTAKEDAFGVQLKSEENEAYYYSTFACSFDILKKYPVSGFSNRFLDIAEDDRMKNQFRLLEPIRYWLEIIELEGKYYMVLALG